MKINFLFKWIIGLVLCISCLISIAQGKKDSVVAVEKGKLSSATNRIDSAGSHLGEKLDGISSLVDSASRVAARPTRLRKQAMPTCIFPTNILP